MKNRKLLLVMLFVIILCLTVLLIYTKISKKEAYISYDIDNNCLEYVNSLEEISYEGILDSDYSNTLYLYQKIYEPSYCDDEVCTADINTIKEDYLVCINSIYYVEDGEYIDLISSLDKDESIIKILESLDLITVTRQIDINAPSLSLKELTINYGDTYEINDFIEICADKYSECFLEYEIEEMENYTEVGNYEITIIASDASGNEISNSTTLTIINVFNEVSARNDTTLSCKEKLALNSNPSKIDGFIKYEEVVENASSYKYGVEIINATTKTYVVFSDIGKCLYKESTNEEISEDRSGYSATNEELKNEAEIILKNNLDTIKEAVTMQNGYRNEIGLDDLEYSYNLSLAATMRAIEIYWSGIFEHIRPDGTDFDTTIMYLAISFNYGGENIATNYSSLAKALVGWKNSRAHYKNIISTNYTYTGFGYYNNYYVTLFSN